jgi:Protein of unknown function (DUF3592)
MPSRLEFKRRVERRVATGAPKGRGLVLLSGAALIAAAVGLLWVNIDFARYAVTEFLWRGAEGTVMSLHRTSSPMIRFAGRDGASHSFTEDYILTCGRRSLCFPRHFDPGENVPVVYDAGAPARAFVDDWALSAGVIQWFAEAAGGLVLALMFTLALFDRQFAIGFRIGGRSE